MANAAISSGQPWRIFYSSICNAESATLPILPITPESFSRHLRMGNTPMRAKEKSKNRFWLIVKFRKAEKVLVSPLMSTLAGFNRKLN
jgi:hypothetical protein